MAVKICAIVAMDKNRVIGLNNQLPWKLPEDLKRFGALTTGHTVVMGRKTYQSLPGRFRPLPKRKNIVITRGTAQQYLLPKEVEVRHSVDELLQDCREGKIELPSGVVWIIGGAEIYAATVKFWDEIFLTKVANEHEGDVHFPPFEEQFTLNDSEDHGEFAFEHYVRKSA